MNQTRREERRTERAKRNFITDRFRAGVEGACTWVLASTVPVETETETPGARGARFGTGHFEFIFATFILVS